MRPIIFGAVPTGQSRAFGIRLFAHSAPSGLLAMAVLPWHRAVRSVPSMTEILAVSSDMNDVGIARLAIPAEFCFLRDLAP
jgi:hypothetical protein